MSGRNLIPCELCGEPTEKTRPWTRFCFNSCKPANWGKQKQLRDAHALLARLKGFTIPAEQILPPDLIREVLRRRLCGAANNAHEMLDALRKLENDLIELGGSFDPVVADTIAMVKHVFPDCRPAQMTMPIYPTVAVQRSFRAESCAG